MFKGHMDLIQFSHQLHSLNIWGVSKNEENCSDMEP